MGREARGRAAEIWQGVLEGSRTSGEKEVLEKTKIREKHKFGEFQKKERAT